MSEHFDSSLTVAGISHKAAPISLRERFAVPAEHSGRILEQLRQGSGAAEAALLTTCNRTECYARGADPDAVRAALASLGGDNPLEYEPLIYVKNSAAMIKHAFSVASGLDSMIIGEPEILGQMKEAYRRAQESGHCGQVLGWVFERAFRVAKTVRSETAISHLSLSIPALCARVSGRIFGSLADCRILCIGAGTVIEAALSYFDSHQSAEITVASRTSGSARLLAQRFAGTRAASLDEARQQLARFDIVLCATASATPILGKGIFERSLRERKRRPIAVFDLSVPRNVEPEVSELEDVFLHKLDDLGKLAAANRDRRMAAAGQAQAIIDAQVAKFCSWLTARDASATIRKLRVRIGAIRDTESSRAKAAVASGADPAEQIEMLAARLAQRLAHEPTRALADFSDQPELAAEISSWYRDDCDEQDNRDD